MKESLPEITVVAVPEPVPNQRAILACAAALLALALLVIWRWRRYKLRHYVWTLPEREVRPRLGGTHCGGGTWIDYR